MWRCTFDMHIIGLYLRLETYVQTNAHFEIYPVHTDNCKYIYSKCVLLVMICNQNNGEVGVLLSVDPNYFRIKLNFCLGSPNKIHISGQNCIFITSERRRNVLSDTANCAIHLKFINCKNKCHLKVLTDGIEYNSNFVCSSCCR